MNRPAPWQGLAAGLIERRPFRVGGAVVDPVSRDAKWSGGEERLQPQTLKVLITLFSRRGEVVTRDELVQLCWDGRIVGDDVINRSISLLRHFAEQAGGFEIETVPRTGYRLVEGDSSAASVPKGRWIAAAAALTLVVAAVAGWAWLGRRHPSQGVPQAPNISVAPFAAEGNDPLARQVARAAPISIEHMMSESGFAVVRGDAPAGSGGANDYVFSGDVRRSATSVDATVQLVSRRDGTIAYTHDFSAPIDSAADLPDQIGAAIAAELAWTGAQMVLDPRERLGPEIESELMQAMVLTIEAHDSLRAYQMVRHVAGLAPNSAFAQLSLGVVTGFSIDSIPQAQRADALVMARRASERAQAMAPEFGDVYIPWCLLHSPVRMIECDAHLRKAERVDSSTSFAPGYLSSVLESAGRIDESTQLAKVSLANDPYKPAKLARMIRLFEASGRSDEAEPIFQRAMRLWPDSSGRMRGSRFVGMAERGNYDGLAAFADPTLDAPMIDAPAFAALLAARRKHDLAGAQRACSMQGITDFTLTLCMTILADLGDSNRSFAIAASLYPASQAPAGMNADQFWLDHPDGYETGFLAGPAAKSMRADPRFLAMASKLGLLDYWRKDGLPDFCRPPQPEPVCAQIRRR